eukprot:10470-Heterococcus_DN1.PRE.1
MLLYHCLGSAGASRNELYEYITMNTANATAVATPTAIVSALLNVTTTADIHHFAHTLYITTLTAAVTAATTGDASSVCSEANAGSSALHAALVQRYPEAVWRGAAS